EAARSPVGKRRGWHAGPHATELLRTVQPALVDRPGIAPPRWGPLSRGRGTPAGDPATTPTRTARPHPRRPYTTAATPIAAQCGSAQQAAHLIAGLISTDALDTGMACGLEAMRRVGLGANIGGEAGRPRPESWAIDMPNQYAAAERIAARRGLSRNDIDTFGAASQQKAAQAWHEGRFDQEVAAIKAPVLDE